ncbi:hypothetical protein Q428_10450 [Fervidicella metallireducens AeB]|uniref:Uncharacterized protein n=1 Tax=Fervidicella metallireducens AeB TaxID=1403537 RepID=A0A017RTJ3_9CLOT|nr:hypothetical protein [Fervidicella metallireducens]EYE87982.1 hypothetical protein Q428_10450 [Fervidicella metallireducens AeB]
MIRLWGKIIKENRILLNEVVICNEKIEYQQELKKCINELCYKFDISKPYWLPNNLEEFNKFKKTSFKQDNFIEEIDFDRFEIIVLEEK